MKTGKEWLEKYGKLGQRVADKRVIFFATTDTMVVMSDRIWGQGGLSEGGRISYKEDYDLYAYKPPAPRKVTGRGKPDYKGKTKKIKGGYYTSYLAFKQQQGRGDLPFELTGDLRRSWLGGVRPTPTEIDPLMCVIDLSAKEAKKAEGLADQKGEFLKLTPFEVRFHAKRCVELYNDAIQGL